MYIKAAEIAFPEPDFRAEAKKKTDLNYLWKFPTRKITNAIMEKIFCQSTIATLMQPL